MPTPRQHTNQAEKQRAYRERQKQARAAEQQAKGLPPLPKVATLPGTARWRSLADAARQQLEVARDEMEQYAADRSEAWREGQRAEEHQVRLDALETAISALDELNW